MPGAELGYRFLAMEASEQDREQLESDAADAVVELDELLNRPGTYFNPQNEVLVVVDDSSPSTRRSSTWRPTRAPSGCGSPTTSPMDEQQRDALLLEFQTHYHPGLGGSVSETALEQGDEEYDEGEDGQEPGRED